MGDPAPENGGPCALEALIRDCRTIAIYLLGRTHKSAPCKRGSVNVRFAPKATELLRCRKTSLCADCWNAAKLFARDHLRKNRCTTPKAGLESVAEVVDIYQQATRRQR